MLKDFDLIPKVGRDTNLETGFKLVRWRGCSQDWKLSSQPTTVVVAGEPEAVRSPLPALQRPGRSDEDQGCAPRRVS